jgi:CMP-N,N'-diacetyllegionaminic acid synthase
MVYAIIPARGGSQRIPHKNMRIFCGKPLIYWTIQTAIESKIFDRIIVSSDDDEVLNYSKGLGVIALKRPTELATNTAKSIDTVFHIINRCEMKNTDLIMLLQPTSPLRTKDNIIESIMLLNDYDSLVSVNETSEGHFQFNGAIYLNTVEFLKKTNNFYNINTYLYQMPKDRSIDIDTEYEWSLAEFLMSQNNLMRD